METRSERERKKEREEEKTYHRDSPNQHGRHLALTPNNLIDEMPTQPNDHYKRNKLRGAHSRVRRAEGAETLEALLLHPERDLLLVGRVGDEGQAGPRRVGCARGEARGGVGDLRGESGGRNFEGCRECRGPN